MRISLILPLHNSEKYLPECMESIENQSFTDFELIIIDDFSSDGTAVWLKKKGYKFYTNDSNLGFCMTINKGIRLAKGDYVAILDHDMVYEKDYLKKSMMINSEIMGARSYYYKDKNKIRALNINVSPLTSRTKVTGRDEIDHGQYNYLKEINAIGAGSMIVKKEVFNKVGLFNTSLIMYFVDLDFCYRARKKGYKIVLTKARCWHKKQEGETLSKEQKQRYFHDKIIFMKYYPLAYILTRIQLFLNGF